LRWCSPARLAQGHTPPAWIGQPLALVHPVVERSRAKRWNSGVEAGMATTWQPTMLVQCVSLKPWLSYPGCDEAGGCHDLTLGRIYELLGIEADGAFYRILDDSGGDYLYPASHFRVV
jgi:hypothetical protein